MNFPLPEISRLRWLQWFNTTSKTIPPFGVFASTGTDANAVIQGAAATQASQFVYVNGPTAVPAANYGECTQDSPFWAAYSYGGGGAPAQGTAMGPDASGDFLLHTSQTGFIVEGGATTGAGAQVWVRRVPSSAITTGAGAMVTLPTYTQINNNSQGTGIDIDLSGAAATKIFDTDGFVSTPIGCAFKIPSKFFTATNSVSLFALGWDMTIFGYTGGQGFGALWGGYVLVNGQYNFGPSQVARQTISIPAPNVFSVPGPDTPQLSGSTILCCTPKVISPTAILHALIVAYGGGSVTLSNVSFWISFLGQTSLTA